MKEIIQYLKNQNRENKENMNPGNMEIMRKQSGTTSASINSRIQEIEKRISSAEDTIEKIDSLAKENIKSNKSLTQNIQDIWDTVNRLDKNRNSLAT